MGERIGEWQGDNGLAFFRYCYDNDGDVEPYFVLKRNLKCDFVKRCGSKQLLVYGSYRHVLYTAFAEAFLYTHSHRDIFYNPLFRFVRRGKVLVFLQHGVTGFKTIDKGYRERAKSHDITVSVSQVEKRLLADAGFPKNSIFVTGFPRFDYLKDTSKEMMPGIVAFMPTWRDWLTDENFLGSRYLQSITSLVNNPELDAILERSELVLKVFLHVNMTRFFGHFSTTSERVELVPFKMGEVASIIAASRYLITDYSSVSWDFLYLEKPVTFFQFDVDEYLSQRGSYLDLKRDAFGEVVYTASQLIAGIRRVVGRRFEVDGKYKEMRLTYFEYIDRRNCARLFDAVNQMTLDRR